MATTPVSAVSSTATMDRNQFLQLLTTQLKNQDPLNPVDDTQFTTQLAQFSQLEGIENLNASFADLLALQQLTEGANLVGRNVLYTQPGTSALGHGTVDSVTVLDGKLQVSVGGAQIPVDQIRGFQQGAGG